MLATCPVTADTLRIATWHIEARRDGPGLLLRDILRDADPQIAAIAAVLARVRPDIVLLQRVDYDLGLVALSALRDRVARDGPVYPHVFALRPNSGMPTGLDMDGDGRRGGPRDAQGWGLFSGHGGMALLSRYPVAKDNLRDLSDLLWQDLPGAHLPQVAGRPFPSDRAAAVQRLAYVGQWVVPVTLPSGPLTLLAFHASPPVFDGPERANHWRNHDELRFWRLYLGGHFGPAPKARFVLLGNANQDPVDGAGEKAALRAMLADPRLQNVRPMRPGPVAPAPDKAGDSRLHTVDWPATGPGPLRVSYILPSADLRIGGAGIHWPPETTPEGRQAATASRHRLVWVDVDFDR